MTPEREAEWVAFLAKPCTNCDTPSGRKALDAAGWNGGCPECSCTKPLGYTIEREDLVEIVASVKSLRQECSQLREIKLDGLPDDMLRALHEQHERVEKAEASAAGWEKTAESIAAQRETLSKRLADAVQGWTNMTARVDKAEAELWRLKNEVWVLNELSRD